MEKLSSLYVKIEKEILLIIRKSILKSGSESLFLKKVKQLYGVDYKSRYMVNHWINSNWIPSEVLKTSCDILKLDYWEMLDGKYVRGSCGNAISFSKKTTPEMANLFGWVLTDGSIPSSTNQ